MTRNKYFNILTITVLSSIFLSSCFSDLDEKPSVYGDAFIKAKLQADSSVNYNLELFAYSWGEMEEVEVGYESSGDRIKLDTFDYKYSYSYQPKTEIASAEIPKSGQYYFYITFSNGYETATTDYLMDQVVDPPLFNKVYWNDDSKQIELAWEESEGAQLYGVILLDQDGKIAFESDLYGPDQKSLIINQFTYGWYNGRKPTSSTTYTLQLSALLFEPINSTMDIQCISVNELTTFEWLIDN